MFTSPWRKQTFPIAIDLGTYSVKVLQLSSGGQGAKLEVLAQDQYVWPEPVSVADPAYHTKVAAVVNDIIGANGFKRRTVVSSLPASVVTFKNLRLPSMPAEEMTSAVQWEARDLAQDQNIEFSTQFLDAGPVYQGDQIRREIILMATPEDFVEQHVDALSAVGLELQAIETAPVALTRWLSAVPNVENDQQARVVIDVGYHATKVLVVRDGVACFFKLIEVAGRDFDRAVTEKLGIDQDQLVNLRQQLTQTELDSVDKLSKQQMDELGDSVRAAMRQPLADLANEISLCLRYYSVTFHGQRPASAQIVGGSVHWPWLPQMLGQQTGLHLDTPQADKSIQSRQYWPLAMGSSLRLRRDQPTRGVA